MSELTPHMTANEIAVFSAFCSSAHSYVEFGCGGSTYLAAKLILNSLISVDCDRDWLAKSAAACKNSSNKLNLISCLIDLGPTREWGYPDDLDRRAEWPKYHEQVWEIPGACAADLYFIDGRFRVACFLQTILNTTASPIILIHDYLSRPHYHAIEEFAEKVCQIDDLAGLRRKLGFSRLRANTVLEEHRFDPR